MFKYIWLLLFLVAGFFTLKAEFYRNDYAEFEDFVFRFYYLTCLLLAIALVWSWIRFYRANKKIPALLPLILPLLFLGLAGFIITQRNERQHVSVFLTAGFETIRLELRIDSTYRIREVGEFSGESWYGKFRSRGDTIFLDRPYDLTIYFSEKLLIDKGNSGTSGNSRTYIFQLDRKGNVIDSLKKLPVWDEN